MSAPKSHNFLLQVPKPLAKEFKKMARSKGRFLNSLIVEFMEKSVKEWKSASTVPSIEDKLEGTGSIPLPLESGRPRPPYERKQRQRVPKSPVESGLSFRKPKAFTFLGKHVQVSSWADIPPSLCALLLDKHRADFNKVLKIGGRKSKYFDTNPTNMFYPKKIPGSSIYVETNWSSSGTLRFCGKVLFDFGYNDNDLQVDIR